ncbi:hypothetical protein [Mycobacteroides salmoniphilum]|uniref:hypothetical protein n=1 Tax=Mycobacteroides salmoniphilum TaxID=404941 RepID=UPI000993D9CA|nr:hypothetical protein [Mycobacteroides salmoniphilum]
MATWGISGPVDLLRRTGFLWWRCWPRLIGIWLVGWLARYWLIKLAVYVGLHFGGYWGDLIMPLAALARLTTYTLMYLVLRGESDLVGQNADGRSRFQSFVDILLKAILPVFVLFAAWRLILADYSSYLGLLNVDIFYAMDSGLAPDRTAAQAEEFMTPSDWRAYLAILIAFVIRGALTRYSEKLPAWTQLVAVYLQALWVVLLLNAASNRLVGSPKWIAERKVIVWYTEQKQHVLAHLSRVGEVWKWITDAMGPMVLAVLLAVTWIAIVGTVYAVRPDTTWAGVSRAAFGPNQGGRVTDVASRTGQAAKARWQRLPRFVQMRASEIFRNLLGVADQLGDTLRLTLHSGPLTFCFFVFAFMGTVVLDPNGAYFNVYVTDGYMWRAVAMLLGPHEWIWWASYRESIRIAIAALIDPLRVCLVVAMYWHCVERVSSPAITQEV